MPDRAASLNSNEHNRDKGSAGLHRADLNLLEIRQQMVR